jgi:hypothetical protein
MYSFSYCDIESNCIETPTWIIILVPILLGLIILVLLLIVIVKIRNRNAVDRYMQARNQNNKNCKLYLFYYLGRKNSRLKEILIMSIEILEFKYEYELYLLNSYWIPYTLDSLYFPMTMNIHF